MAKANNLRRSDGRKKKIPKTILVCGCFKLDQRDERFIKKSLGEVCECTERDRTTGVFLSGKSGKGLKEVNFGSISLTKASDTGERVA